MTDWLRLHAAHQPITVQTIVTPVQTTPAGLLARPIVQLTCAQGHSVVTEKDA